MAGYLTPATERLLALLAGTYPATATPPARQIPPGTFVLGASRPVGEEGQFPAADYDRRFDLEWTAGEYGGRASDAENQMQGPHVRRAYATLRVSYALAAAQDAGLSPREGATRKALEDAAVIEWAIFYTANWTGTNVIQCRRGVGGGRPRPTTDARRLALDLPLVFDVQVTGVTSPGLGG